MTDCIEDICCDLPTDGAVFIGDAGDLVADVERLEHQTVGTDHARLHRVEHGAGV